MTSTTNQKPSFNKYCQNLNDHITAIKVTGPDKIRISEAAGSERVQTFLEECRQNHRKVFIIGNGGSAAIAAHIQNDLCNGAGIRSLSCQDIPTLTALSNDHGYARAYERFIKQWAAAGDLVIAVSSSGESENILRAVTSAAEIGCRIFTMSGFKADNRLRQLGDINFYVPAEHYGHVETIHAIIGHFITDTAQLQG